MNDMRSAGEPDYTDADFQRVRRIAQDEAGIYFPDTKRTLVYSRVSRRVREAGHASFHSYLDFVQTVGGRGEMERLICALTTNVTNFFREKTHFMHLEEIVVPKLAAQVRAGGRGRLWSAACSTGQEPWSIAMSVMTAFPDAPAHDVRILATDINADVVAHAAAGIYPTVEAEAIPAEKKSQFMEPHGDGGLRFTGGIRNLPAFRVLNLNANWPMKGTFSAIFCRNVVIYFDEATRERLWHRLADRLDPGGFLCVGHSERVASKSQCGLEQIAPTIYRKES